MGTERYQRIVGAVTALDERRATVGDWRSVVHTVQRRLVLDALPWLVVPSRLRVSWRVVWTARVASAVSQNGPV